jgi:hypothetical protein
MATLLISGRTRNKLAPVTTRLGTTEDVDLVVAMHRRCSTESLHRRFHSAQPSVSPSLAAKLLQPSGGWSLVALHYGEVVGLAVAAPMSSDELEIAMLVEDSYQGVGIGGCFADELAAQGFVAGYRTLHCLTQADNHAVIRAMRSGGLPVHAEMRHGVTELVVDLRAAGQLLASA